MFEKLYTAPDQIALKTTSPLEIYSFTELNLPDTGVATALGKRPYVIMNMIASVDGRATTHQGQLVGLSSREDRRVMRYLRCQVDGVLVGAGTLRADPIVPTLPPDLVTQRIQHFDPSLAHAAQPWGIVVTQSGLLPLEHRFWLGGKNQRLIIAADTKSVHQDLLDHATIWTVPGLSKDLGVGLSQALGLLYQRLAIKRLVVEGGATLNYALVAAGLVDELFLTVAPCLVGGLANGNILAGAGFGFGAHHHLPKLDLLSVYHRDSYLFLRYRVVAT